MHSKLIKLIVVIFYLLLFILVCLVYKYFNSSSQDVSDESSSDRNSLNSNGSNENRFKTSEDKKNRVSEILRNLTASFMLIDLEENKRNYLNFIENITPNINKLNAILKDPEYKSVIEGNKLYKYACDTFIESYNFIKDNNVVDENYIYYLSRRVLSLKDDVERNKIDYLEFKWADKHMTHLLQIMHITPRKQNIDDNILNRNEIKLSEAFVKLAQTALNVYGENSFEKYC